MDVILQHEFRDFVRDQMAKQNLSQGELARRMGVSRPMVSQYLSGVTSPGMDVVEKFYRALGFTPSLGSRPIEPKLSRRTPVAG